MNHYAFAEFFGTFGANDFVNGVFYHRRRYPRGNIVHSRAVLLRLLNGAVHEHGATRTQFDGVKGKQSQSGKFRDAHTESVGNRLYKRTAAGRARFVKHDIVYRFVLDFETLDVLTADVDNEIYVGTKFQRRGKVRNSFDNAEIEFKSRFQKFFPVARYRRRHYLYSVAHERIKLFQFFGHDVQRPPYVLSVMAEKNFAILAQQYHFRSGGTCVDAQICFSRVCCDILSFHVGSRVAADKLVVFFMRGKKRSGGKNAFVGLRVEYLVQNVFGVFPVCISCRVKRCPVSHEARRKVGKNRVFGTKTQSLGKSVLQSLIKMQRTTEELNYAYNLPALRKSRDCLFDYRLKNACRNVLERGALIEKRLNVAFCENSATRRYWINVFCRQSKLVQLIARNLEKRSHLVDKRTRAACAGAVHPLFGSAGKKKDFSVFSAQFHRAVRVGIHILYCKRSGVNFLYETQSRGRGQSQPRRTRHSDFETAGIKGKNTFQLFANRFLYLGKMPVVYGMYYISFFIKQYALYGSGPDVHTHRVFLFHSSNLVFQ